MFYFGADYYPEHWPEERWPEDARLMNEAGFNVVRLAEFAWALMEPEEGRFDFSWLDRAIEILSAHGIQIVLGTPTASPPPWLMAKQEDLFLVNKSGIRLTYGLRREYCPNNSLYHEHTTRIVGQMAQHYGDNPAVIGWQIDNEFGDRCYCRICQERFQSWLRDRYGSLDELNGKWWRSRQSQESCGCGPINQSPTAQTASFFPLAHLPPRNGTVLARHPRPSWHPGSPLRRGGSGGPGTAANRRSDSRITDQTSNRDYAIV